MPASQKTHVEARERYETKSLYMLSLSHRNTRESALGHGASFRAGQNEISKLMKKCRFHALIVYSMLVNYLATRQPMLRKILSHVTSQPVTCHASSATCARCRFRAFSFRIISKAPPDLLTYFNENQHKPRLRTKTKNFKLLLLT